MSYQKSNILQEPNNYLYNGKELQTDFDLDWYDYGARFYDPGIFISVDPLAKKYPYQSPYGFVGGNPIGNREVDGRYYVGTNGKKVRFRMRKDGTIKIGRNASADLRRLVNAANSTGSSKVLGHIMDVSKNKTKVHVKVVKEKVDNGLYGLHQAHDADGNALNWNSEKGDFDGTPAYVEGEEGVYKEATITVFEGNIEEGGGNGKYYGYDDISTEQEIGHTFGHESNHDSDSEFIQDLRNRREGKPNKGVDAHDNIDDAGMYKEIHDNNKKD